jgi:hypothetical protein
VWPLAAQAQEAGRSYRLGILSPWPRADPGHDAFFDELRRNGFVEGQNLMVDARGFGLRKEQFAEIAATLARSNPDAIFCSAGDPAMRALQAVTQTIPIVGGAEDLVAAGLVASLSLPGGNITGISLLSPELDGKRLEILIEAVPSAYRMAVLADTMQTSEALPIIAGPSAGASCRAFGFRRSPVRGHRSGDRRYENVRRPSRQRSGGVAIVSESASHHRAHDHAAPAGNIPMARHGGGGRLRGLWPSSILGPPARGANGCQNTARCKACRYSRRAANSI